MHSRTERVFWHGTIAGLIGFAIVAIVFAVANIMVGRSPFFTASALGAVFFYGTTDPSAIVVSARTALAFNGVHLLTFLAFGYFGAWLASLAAKGKQLWYPLLFFWLFVAFHMIGAMQMTAFPMESVISSGTLWGAGILASLAMAGYLLRVNPRIMQKQPW